MEPAELPPTALLPPDLAVVTVRLTKALSCVKTHCPLKVQANIRHKGLLSVIYLCLSPPPEPRGDLEPPEPERPLPTLVEEADLWGGIESITVQ